MASKNDKTPSAPRSRSTSPLSRGGESIPFLDKGRVRDGLNFIPYKKKLVSRSREFRKDMTEAEEKIWNELLKGRKLEGYRFVRQKPLGEFIADFYCAKLLMVVEVDGDIHSLSKNKDQERSDYLNYKFGVKVVRYKNNQIINNLDLVKKDLLEEISKRKEELNL